MTSSSERFKTFKEFYPYYLSEHSNKANRTLHCIGSLLVIFELLLFLYSFNYWLLILIPITGYGFAWVGHFFIEKNKPATFIYPVWSLASDFLMLYHTLTFQIDGKLKKD